MKLISITLCAMYLSVGLADTYMHNFRGSNNRLNEKSANRQNANRMFDSQNNNRGGYNVGEFGSTNGFDNNANAYATDQIVFNYDNTDWAEDNAAGRKQSEPVYLEGSSQKLTWTAQHGCGNAKNNCNMVVEYTCDTHPQNVDVLVPNPGAGVNANAGGDQGTQWLDADYRNYKWVTGLRVQLKNGANTNTPNDPNNLRNVHGTFQNNNGDNEGRHESEEWYALAKARERNKGLFTADQKLQGSDSTKTRQNPGGTRRGLEVPEERDYFPYWRPTPWKPVALFHNDLTECEAEMRLKSQVFETKTACAPLDANVVNGGKSANELAELADKKTKAECEAANVGGKWIEYTTTMPEGYPFCVQNKWSQVNNLGNVDQTNKGGLPQNWDWELPTLAQLAESGCFVYQANTPGNQQYVRMVTRIRYNMTTMDYAPYTTTSTCNQNKKQNVQSPVEQNPTVDVGVDMQGLRLALNTAQTGRTFQDRSHVFRVQKMINTGANQPMANAKKIQNVVVQGKRGNIVQTFPAVEYDFWPKIVDLQAGECMTLQWTGSNTHNNGNPAGDGQAGDAGEGRGGSDRSNFIQLTDKNSTFPAPHDTKVNTLQYGDLLELSNVYRTYTGVPVSSAKEAPDAQLFLMSGGFWNTNGDVGANNNGRGNGELNVLLNNAPATMRGLTVCPKAGTKGTFEFTCTRNNNFSNRDQKLTVNVSP